MDRYMVIYDYDGEYDSCKGLNECADSFEEAQGIVEDLKHNPDYHNFSIISLD